MIRVAYAGVDGLSSCLEMLVNRHDAEVVLCLTGKKEDAVDYITRLAGDHNIPVVFGRLKAPAIDAVSRLGIDLLVCAGYPYRLPIEKMSVPRAINIHPTLLPHGRGPKPVPYLVSGECEHCGLSVHILTPDMDRGPVLRQVKLDMLDGEGYDELWIRMFNSAPTVLSDVISDLDRLLGEAKDQDEGSYWPAHSDQDRTIKATESTVADLREASRKFGMSGVIVEVADSRRVQVFRLTAVQCVHRSAPGTISAVFGFGWIVALLDGLALLDYPLPVT